MAIIEPGQGTALNTFVGHCFAFRSARDGREFARTTVWKEAHPEVRLDDGAVAQWAKPTCKDRRPGCGSFVANSNGLGCQMNPGWMTVNCPHGCHACHLLDPKARCGRRELSMKTESAVLPGDIDAMFGAIKAGKFAQLGARIVLDPSEKPNVPWVAVFDNFITPTECDHMVSASTAGKGFERSTDQGGYNEFGEQEKVTSTGRTSRNAWCREHCDNDEYVMAVTHRIENVTGIPYANYENFQVLQYEVGQFYRTHHDMSERDNDMPAGPRVYTFFLYMSDVEEGGETSFPRLDLDVRPKKGRALLWPSASSKGADGVASRRVKRCCSDRGKIAFVP